MASIKINPNGSAQQYLAPDAYFRQPAVAPAPKVLSAGQQLQQQLKSGQINKAQFISRFQKLQQQPSRGDRLNSLLAGAERGGRDLALSTAKAGLITGAGVVNLMNIPLSKLPGYRNDSGGRGYQPVQKAGLGNKVGNFVGRDTTGKQYAGAALQTGALGLGGPEMALLGRLGGKIAPKIAASVADKASAKGLGAALTRAAVTGTKLTPSGAVFGAGQALSDDKDVLKGAITGAGGAFALGAGGSVLANAIGKAKGAMTSAKPAKPASTPPAAPAATKAKTTKVAANKTATSQINKSEVPVGKLRADSAETQRTKNEIDNAARLAEHRIKNGHEPTKADYSAIAAKQVADKVAGLQATAKSMRRNAEGQLKDLGVPVTLAQSLTKAQRSALKQESKAKIEEANAKLKEYAANRSVTAGDNKVAVPAAAGEDKVANAKQFVSSLKEPTANSKSLPDNLHRLETNATADKITLTKFLKSTEHLDQKDLEAAYHYSEDKNHPVTKAQKEIYDTYVRPMQQETASAKSRLAGKNIILPSDNHMHRIAMDKGSRLERFIKGDVRNPVGSALRKTTDSSKQRTMKAIVDERGNRTVVSIKTSKNKVTGRAVPGGKQVTAFVNGKATRLGPMKRKLAPAITEFYDKHVMASLNKATRELGIIHTRTNKSLGKGVAGSSRVNAPIIKTRAATPEQVLLHEIGHQVDRKYGMQEAFLKGGKTAAERKQTNEEMRALADLRHEGIDASKYFKNYVRSGPEKMAVMFEAYLHAPQRFQEVAPNLFKKFTAFLDKHEELHTIRDIKPSLVLDSARIGEENVPGMFVDKSGKAYRITDATTKEIEQHTGVKYYKNPIVNSALDLLQTRQAERASQMIDQWKKTPEFNQIAVGEGKPIPSGWKPTTAPQFRGYYFEPKTAEVLDDFAGRINEDPLNALGAMNRFLRTTIFFSPLLHIPNVATHWAVNRGLKGFATPQGYMRLVSTGAKAINEVLHQGPMYKEMLRQGAPMMAFDSNRFSGQMMKLMDSHLENPTIGKKVADALGYANPKKLLEAWYGVSHKSTWYSNDILTMQAIMEEMNKGKTMREAITQVGKHIPDYRVPSRIAGSRDLKNLLTNPNVSMFTAYHYGILKNYAQTVRSLVGKHVPAAERAGAVDKLMAAGLIAFVLYPEMDKFAKHFTGNDASIMRRAGPFTWPYNVYEAARGTKTPSQVATGIVTPAPGTKSLYEVLRNKDTFGNDIYSTKDLTSNPRQFVTDVGKYLENQVSPLGLFNRANKGNDPQTIHQNRVKAVGTLIGISNPKTPTEAKIQRLLNEQLNSQGMTTDEQRTAQAKAAARAQLANGQGDSLTKQLVKDGVIAKDKEGDFKKSASMTPLQRSFNALSTANKLEVLKSAPPKERQKFGDMRETMIQAAGTMHNSSAKPETKQAAQELIRRLGGDPTSLYYQYRVDRRQRTLQSKLRNAQG